MKKIAKFRILMLLAALALPVVVGGCRGEIDDDGADLEVG